MTTKFSNLLKFAKNLTESGRIEHNWAGLDGIHAILQGVLLILRDMAENREHVGRVANLHGRGVSLMSRPVGFFLHHVQLRLHHHVL